MRGGGGGAGSAGAARAAGEGEGGGKGQQELRGEGKGRGSKGNEEEGRACTEPLKHSIDSKAGGGPRRLLPRCRLRKKLPTVKSPKLDSLMDPVFGL